MRICQGGPLCNFSSTLFEKKKTKKNHNLFLFSKSVHKNDSLLCPTDHRRSFEMKTFRTVLRNKTSPRKGQKHPQHGDRRRGPVLPSQTQSTFHIYIYLYMEYFPLYLCFLTSALCRGEHLWSQIIFHSSAI